MKRMISYLAITSLACLVAASGTLTQQSFGLITDPFATSNSNITDTFVNHFSASRPGTDVYLQNLITELYPNSSVVVTQDFRFNLLGYSQSGEVVIREMEDIQPIKRAVFEPAKRRRDGQGQVYQRAVFAGYKVAWREEEFIAIVASWAEGYSYITQWHLITEAPASAANELIRACSFYSSNVRDAILVFEQSSWRPNHDLWESVQKASWKDVILDDKLKTPLRRDVSSFLKSEKVYKDLNIAWKRGLIFTGPPGNGKTVSLKAIMKSIGMPVLYVKSFHSYAGDEGGIQMVFARARSEAPCLLVLEDLDSLITDQNRSFFLNEVDGITENDGLMIIATTNHLDKLDPALSSRPSRFDRKFLFPNPSEAERKAYAIYWQEKLAHNKEVSFPDSLTDEIAHKTKDFSFSYLKEAFISALVIVAGQESHQKPDTFRTLILSQIAELRAELDREKSIWKPARDI